MANDTESPDFVALGTRARKFAAALVGATLQIVQMNVLPERYQAWATGIVAFLTALGVYTVRNEPV